MKQFFILGTIIIGILIMNVCTDQKSGVPAASAETVAGKQVIIKKQVRNDRQLRNTREFLLTAYNPPYARQGPPYDDYAFTYYKNAHFDTLLQVRDDDALMLKVRRFGFKYLVDVGSVIEKNLDLDVIRGEDYLRGGPDSAPPAITDEMLQLFDDAIEKYQDDPNLLGYYICDEPFSTAFQNIAKIVQEIKEKDPTHVGFVNLWPYFKDDLGEGRDIGDDTYLEDFIRITHIELLCSDRYNFYGDEQGNVWDDNGEYFAQLARLRYHASAHHIPFCNIIQAVGTIGTSEGGPDCVESEEHECLDWRTPGRAEHRWLVYSSLAYGVHGIIWFHWDGRDWGVVQNPDRDAVYSSLQSINAEISVLKEIMLHLTTTAVYHTDDVHSAGSAGTKFQLHIQGNTPLLVGFFREEDGEKEKYFMLMNKNYAEPVTPQILTTPRLTGLQVFNVDHNQWEGVPLENRATGTSFMVDLSAGGGKLFRFSAVEKQHGSRGCLPAIIYLLH